MTPAGPRRVMWLLNHSASRKFEVPMLKRVGITEIFLPKIFPSRVSFRSANVDYSEDAHLTIPDAVLQEFNSTDWYQPQSEERWKLASQYFDVVFFINEESEASTALLRFFEGAAIWRAYGLDKSLTYTKVAQRDSDLEPAVIRARDRFWFGQAYSNLAKVEANYLKSRKIDFPLGMPDSSMRDQWEGTENHILFVCPDLGFNPYYQGVYEQFKLDFGDLPYVVGGAQPVAVTDPKVLGFLSADAYARNMRQLKVMYYHSAEPRHIHYHPFEAIRAGMPLIYMADGMLDNLGGKNLPGRAKNVRDARSKLKRILAGDKKFINLVRSSQIALLDAMNFDRMVPVWQQAMATVLAHLDDARSYPAPKTTRKKRIAVLVPVGYRGGSLRGAKLLAKAISLGSADANEPAEVVLGHLDDQRIYSVNDFEDVHPSVKVRPFKWTTLDRATAKRAMSYSGTGTWAAAHKNYLVPDDGIQQFTDCDLWVIVSDRVEKPILPIRPVVAMIYDYIQRYVPIMAAGADVVLLHAARSAKQVLVTTEFTRKDAIGYAGVASDKVTKVPMLAPELDDPGYSGIGVSRAYFIWSSNAAPHKNHATAIEALSIYYNVLDGDLDCVLTGVNTRGLTDDSQENLQTAARIISSNRTLRQRLKIVGELEETQYRSALKGAAFLWHPGTIDNGTFSVVEAAKFSVPALSTDYPAMREIDQQFGLHLNFSPSDHPRRMAERLKWMEDNAQACRAELPSAESLAEQDVKRLGSAYWEVLRRFL